MASCAAAGTLPDEILALRFRNGEEEAFSQLYARYKLRVLSTANRIIRNPTDAQDATQEIFLKLYRTLPEWNPSKARLSTWLYRLAANHAIDCWRARRRRLALEIAGETGGEIIAMHTASEPAATPYRALAMKEETGEIQRCLERLPELQRRFFILRYLYGLSLNEIAAREARSLGTVKGLLFRATRAVRRRLIKSNRT